MANTQAQPQVDDSEIDDDKVELEMFNQAVIDDPDIADEDKPTVEEGDEPPAGEQPQGEVTPQGEAQPQDEVPAQPTGFEWLEDLPDEKRGQARQIIDRQGQQIARLEQRVASHLGQLQPAQRVISQLQQRLRQVESQRAKESPSMPDVEKHKKAVYDRIDKEYEEFPEEAAKLKALFAESLDGVVRSIPSPPARPEAPAMAGPDPRSEIQHLVTAYSDWGERRFSPEFDNWFARQSPDTQQMLNSPYASDNVALLDAFTRDNPDWVPPQTAEEFHSLAQAQHSPLYRGWAQAEGINPDLNLAQVPDYTRDMILQRFKTDLGAVRKELEHEPTKDTRAERLAQRRSKQLEDRAPGSVRRSGIKPGQPIDLDTEVGQRAYFDQLVATDPDLR